MPSRQHNRAAPVVGFGPRCLRAQPGAAAILQMREPQAAEASRTPTPFSSMEHPPARDRLRRAAFDHACRAPLAAALAAALLCASAGASRADTPTPLGCVSDPHADSTFQSCTTDA